MKKIILLIVVIGVIAGGWFLYLNNGSTGTAVNTSEAKYMDLKSSLEFSGKVVPKSQYSVMSETGGTVKDINVSEGSTVNIGDSLFELDSADVENLLEQAQLNYDMLDKMQSVATMSQGTGLEAEKAKVALALSQTTGYDYDSFNNAFSGQLADNAAQMASNLQSMSLDEATSGAAATNLTDDKLKLAKLQVDQLQDKLDGMSFSSLLKGTVVTVNIHKGEVLPPGVPAMIIADTNNIYIDGYIYEKDLHNLSENMQVDISTDEGHFTGTIRDIAKVAASSLSESDYGTMTKVQINPDKLFKKIPGADVDLEVVLRSKENALAIPIDCITQDGYVYVVGKNNLLEKRKVETGFTNDFYAEIVSGVALGDRVVLSPQNLSEGQEVTYDRS